MKKIIVIIMMTTIHKFYVMTINKMKIMEKEKNSTKFQICIYGDIIFASK